MNVFSLISLSGSSPYNIYVCDITNTYCFLVSGSTSIPPLISFVVPPPLDIVNEILLKIVDDNGCEKYYYYSCDDQPIKQFQDLSTFNFMDGEIYQFE
jgi:hypothetical protein